MVATVNASTSAGVVITPDNSGVLAFQSSSATALTIDASQNVGIGTATPTDDGGYGKIVDIYSSTGGAVYLHTSTATNYAFLGKYNSSTQLADSGSAGLTFATASGSTPVERMRIDSSGNFMVGTTSVYNSAKVSINQATNTSVGMFIYKTVAGDVGTAGLQIAKYDNNSTTSQVFAQFLINNANTGSGQINANGASAAAFGSYSDSRLKENITNLPSQLANIMALRPVEFDYIQSEGGGHQIGFIAQEVNEIYPDLVGERADGMFTLTDLNKNDARLIKAIQELKAINDTQAETINALTARIVALENR